jgi:hypothetical protein
MRKAECVLRKIDPKAFFDTPTPAIVFDACSACKVQVECLLYSFEAEAGATKDGIWGGYTPRQRQEMSKGRPTHRIRSARELEKDRSYKHTSYRRDRP